ncbi:MAG: nucleoside permease [Saprospiraceae bacterium]
MKTSIRVQLSIMMFLQFFVWGCWYATVGNYLSQNLGYNGAVIGGIFSTISIAAIISPLFVGIIADRFFEAQRVLAVSHVIGAGILYYLSSISDPDTFYWILLLYSIFYMPTLALTNAVSFYQMTSPEKEFPGIRVLGTIGWIIAGLIISFAKLEASSTQFIVAAVASLITGLYCFTLPNTPSESKGQPINIGKLLGLDALKLMKNRNFAVLVISSFLVSIPLNFYFAFANNFLNEAGMEFAAAKMTLGQASEIIFMLLMPFFFSRLGVKKMILVGILAWILRYVLFAYGDNQTMVWMFYSGILLHGICYDFFFVTGQIYVDNEAPEEVRASAQGLITLATYGIGMYLGAIIAGQIVNNYTIMENGAEVGHDWTQIWLIPAGLAVAVLLLFLAFFREDEKLA